MRLVNINFRKRHLDLYLCRPDRTAQTHIIGEDNSCFPDLVLDVNGAESEKEKQWKPSIPPSDPRYQFYCLSSECSVLQADNIARLFSLSKHTSEAAIVRIDSVLHHVDDRLSMTEFHMFNTGDIRTLSSTDGVWLIRDASFTLFDVKTTAGGRPVSHASIPTRAMEKWNCSQMTPGSAPSQPLPSFPLWAAVQGSLVQTQEVTDLLTAV